MQCLAQCHTTIEKILLCAHDPWHNNLVKKLRMPQKFHEGNQDAVCKKAIYGSVDQEKGQRTD
jgi:hypothetical protein